MPNEREWASAFWLAAILVFVMWRTDTRTSALGVVRLALKPPILDAVLIFLAYVGTLVAFGWLTGWWTSDLWTDTVVWIGGPGVGLLFGISIALTKPGFFASAAKKVLRWTLAVEFFLRFAIFSFWIELIAQPVIALLVVLSITAGQKPEYAQLKRILDFGVALVGLGLLVYGIGQVVGDWEAATDTENLRAVALPLWLVIGTLPVIYLLSLWIAYAESFQRIDQTDASGRNKWRAKFALLSMGILHPERVAAIRPYWLSELTTATSFSSARAVLVQHEDQKERRRREEAEAAERLVKFADVDGQDEGGLRLDQREFDETRKALQWLATAQSGWHQNRGERYRPELLEVLQSQFESYGLPRDHGIALHVSPDGQAWWAWRRTITGWCFAIGVVGPPPTTQWLFDGPEPPTGLPGDDEVWGAPWGIDAKNWL